MSMAYVRKTYGVPAKRGMKVEVYYRRRLNRDQPVVWHLAKRGRITSATHHLFIDGGGPYHPRHGVVYLDGDGGVLLDARGAAVEGDS